MPKRSILSDSEDDINNLPSRSQSRNKGRLQRRSQRDSNADSDSDVLEEEDTGVPSQLSVNRRGYILDSDDEGEGDAASEKELSIHMSMSNENENSGTSRNDNSQNVTAIFVSTPMGTDLPLKSAMHALVDLLKGDDAKKLRAYLQISLDKYTLDRDGNGNGDGDGDGDGRKKQKKRKRDQNEYTSFLDLLLQASVLNSTRCMEFLLNLPTKRKEMNDFLVSESVDIDEEAEMDFVEVNKDGKSIEGEHREMLAQFTASLPTIPLLDLTEVQRLLTTLRLGKRVLIQEDALSAHAKKSPQAKAFALHVCSPFVYAMLTSNIDMALLFCDYCPDHVFMVLKTVLPHSNNNQQGKNSQNIINVDNDIDTSNDKKSANNNNENDNNEEEMPFLFQLLRDDYCMNLCSVLVALDRAVHIKENSRSYHAALDLESIRKIKRQREYRANTNSKRDAKRGNSNKQANHHSGTIESNAVRSLLEKCTISGGGVTILHHCCSEGAYSAVFVETVTSIAPFLLHSCDKRGLYPVHYACAVGNATLLEVLLKAGASPMVVDEEGWSPFLYSLMMQHVECALCIFRESGEIAAVHQLRLLGHLCAKPQCSESKRKKEGGSHGYDEEDETEAEEEKGEDDDYDYSDEEEEEEDMIVDGKLRSGSSTKRLVDNRLKKMITSLASVPEFQVLLNRIVKNNLSLLDEELGYLLMYPSLLNLENKLFICHKALVHLDAEASTNDKYPLLSAASPSDDYSYHKTQPILIHRTERGHWEQFCDFVMGRRDTEGSLTALSPMMRSQQSSHSSNGGGSTLKPRQFSHIGSAAYGNSAHPFRNYGDSAKEHEKKKKLGLLRTELLKRANASLRSRIIFQYGGKAEVGIGDGVEREVLEMICRDTMIGAPRSSSSSSSISSGSSIANSSALKLFYTDESQDQICCPLPIHKSGTHLEGFRCFGKLIGHLLLRVFARVDPGNAVSVVRTKASSSSTDHSFDGIRDIILSGGNYLALNLPVLFYKLVLGKEPCLEDLSSFDTSVYQSLCWMQQNTDVQYLDLYFTAPSPQEYDPIVTNQSSRHVNVNLVAKGDEILVTDANKKEYIELMVKHHSVARMGEQAKLVKQGIVDVLHPMVLSLLNEQELHLLLTGCSRIDANDWKQHTSYSNSSEWDSKARRVIEQFWQLVGEMTELERSLLLTFCTGCSRLPSGGFDSLNPPFNVMIVPFRRNASLPTASTCFNLLKLPLYPSSFELRKSILVATKYGHSGFSFS